MADLCDLIKYKCSLVYRHDLKFCITTPDSDGVYTKTQPRCRILIYFDSIKTVIMDIGSVHSLNSTHDHPLPTPRDENTAITVKRFSYVLGFLYSIFLIMFGVLTYTFNATDMIGMWSPIFTLYVAGSGTIILFVLTVDIKLFTRRIRKQVEKLRHKEEEMELEHLRQLDAGLDDNGTGFRNNKEYGTATGFIPQDHDVEHIEHNYCFAKGRHAGSVYLKFGAAAFALGHFVHTLLLVVVIHVSIFINNTDCINVTQYISTLVESLYCFVQLFFIFNYSNLIIIKYATIARVAFLHIMAGNICLWVSAVITETQLAYRAYEWVQIEKNKTSVKFDDRCMPTITVFRIFDDYSAYLYPFTVEFHILTVGIFFIIWRYIGKCCHSREEVRDFHHSLYAQTNVSGDVNSPHVLDIHISCRNSMGGLFSSLFVIVILIVSIIMGFVFGTMDNEYLQRIGHITTHSIELFFHGTMLFVTAVAFWKTRTLDINKHPVPWLDDALLYICVPAFFLETMFTTVATISALHIIQFLDTITMSLQMIIQMAFIVDGCGGVVTLEDCGAQSRAAN
ncbi:proton channel OtopLc-like isoform X2 [Choristoneura fumiferana]|uniref:proton channel OtopLc-like isoform X2 n=1 Tax=Choristoneura fumiferana TaxID=7141 RepID=UPI003D15EA92